MTDTPWIKAQASGGGQQCVQMRRRGDMIEVRDSKNPTGAVLSFTLGEWGAWMDGAKKGEFDHLDD
jgi:uncharacterized protein DUF397